MKYTTTTTHADQTPDTVTTHFLFGNIVYCDTATGKIRNRPTKSAQESAAAIEKALTANDPRPMLDPTNAADLYSMAHAAVAICLRARDNASGQRLISDLRRMWSNDHRWSAAEDMSAAADLYRLTHDQQREQAQEAQAESDKLTRRAAAVLLSEHDRAALLTAAANYAKTARDLKRKAADNLRAAQDIEKQLQELTASDRENIVHAAIVALLELQAPAADPDNPTAELFRYACTAAGRTIDALRAAKAGGYKTKVKRFGDVEGVSGAITHKATAAENAAAYEEWSKAHPNADKVPFAVRGGASAGYYTAEYRNTPRFPDGYYLVSHYVTESAADLDTAADLTRAKAAAVDIRAIAADLTARQRTALYLMAYATGSARPTPSKDPSRNSKAAKAIAAVIRAGDAAAAALDEDTKTRQAATKNDKSRQQMQRRADKRRAKVTRAAMLDKALTLAGVPASQLATQRAALRTRLDRALTASHDTVTKTPAAPDVLKMWSEAAKATEDSRHPYPGHVASLTYTSTTTGRAAALDVVWSTSYDPSKAEALTPDQLTQEAAKATAAELDHQRTHAAKAAGLTIRRQLRDHQPGSRTTWPALDAMTAAAVFFPDSLPIDTWEEIGRAALEEQAAAKAAEQHSREIIRAAQRVTLDAWRKMNRAEKDAVIVMLNS